MCLRKADPTVRQIHTLQVNSSATFHICASVFHQPSLTHSLTQGCRAAGADPGCHGRDGREHPGKVGSSSQAPRYTCVEKDFIGLNTFQIKRKLDVEMLESSKIHACSCYSQFMYNKVIGCVQNHPRVQSSKKKKHTHLGAVNIVIMVALLKPRQVIINKCGNK